jgi:hypothetical protein
MRIWRRRRNGDRRQFRLALAASDADARVGVGWAGLPTPIREPASVGDADLMLSAPLKLKNKKHASRMCPICRTAHDLKQRIETEDLL